MKTCCVVLAAGRGRRVAGECNKMYLPLAMATPLYYTLKQIKKANCFTYIVLVVGEGEESLAKKEVEKTGMEGVIFALGGQTRQESAYAGILSVPKDAEVIAMHDGARCFTSPALFADCIESCIKKGSGVAGQRMTDTVKQIRVDGSFAVTMDRESLVTVQTPQVFYKKELQEAYENAFAEGFVGTDDASLLERMGKAVYIVDMPEDNLKLTHQADFAKAERLLSKMPNYRVGQGYDIHSFVSGRPLILAGVHIPHEQGLDGHSDADVVAHAVMDALLGAANMGDIGELFPDTDAAYKGANSMALLQIVIEKIKKKKYTLQNIDVTIFMEKPKLSPYKESVKASLAAALGAGKDQVNIKAKTAEGHGGVGEGKAAAASATCLVLKEG